MADLQHTSNFSAIWEDESVKFINTNKLISPSKCLFFIWIKVENKEKSIKTSSEKAECIQLVFTEIKCNTSHTALKILIFVEIKDYHKETTVTAQQSSNSPLSYEHLFWLLLMK